MSIPGLHDFSGSFPPVCYFITIIIWKEGLLIPSPESEECNTPVYVL